MYLKEQNEDRYLHSEKLNLFIKESLFKSNISLHKLEAIFISSGPGSYTGLRIGASTAKVVVLFFRYSTNFYIYFGSDVC